MELRKSVCIAKVPELFVCAGEVSKSICFVDAIF